MQPGEWLEAAELLWLHLVLCVHDAAKRADSAESLAQEIYICTFVCLEASKQTVCGKPAKGEHRAGAHPEKPRRSQPAPRAMRDTAACAGTQAEAPQKHPDRVRRPVGGGGTPRLAGSNGRKRASTMPPMSCGASWRSPRARIRSVGFSHVRRCAQPARSSYACVLVYELPGAM